MKSKLTKEFRKGLKHFYDRINFADSNLDADAVRFMNEMPGRLVNSHDALLDACKKAEDFLRSRIVAIHRPASLDKLLMDAIAQAEK